MINQFVNHKVESIHFYLNAIIICLAKLVLRYTKENFLRSDVES